MQAWGWPTAHRPPFPWSLWERPFSHCNRADLGSYGWGLAGLPDLCGGQGWTPGLPPLEDNASPFDHTTLSSGEPWLWVRWGARQQQQGKWRRSKLAGRWPGCCGHRFLHPADGGKYMCAHTHTHTHRCTHLHITCANTCTHITHLSTVHAYPCTHQHSMCANACAHACTSHTYTRTYTSYVHTCTHHTSIPCTHMHAHTCANTHAYTHTTHRTCTFTHTLLTVCMLTCAVGTSPPTAELTFLGSHGLVSLP